MSITVSSGGTGGVNVQDILAEAERASGDARKDAKIDRQLHFDKNMSLLDKNIGALKSQQSQLGKAGWFNFIIGMVSNFLNMASFALSALIPPLTPVIQAANQGLQGILGSLSQINPFSKNAGKEGVKAEEFKKLAQVEEYKFSMDDERLKAMVESDQTFKGRMEKAIENLQESQEVAVRVRV